MDDHELLASEAEAVEREMDPPFASEIGENDNPLGKATADRAVDEVDDLESSDRPASGQRSVAFSSSPRTITSAASSGPASSGNSPRSGAGPLTAKEEAERESLRKVSDLLRRRASDAVSMRRSSTFRVTKEDAATQTGGDLPSLEECLNLREVHNRVRQFSSLLQLWLEDPEGFDFVGEWVGSSLDEESQREAQEAFEQEEVAITGMQEEMAALLQSTDVPNDEKVEMLAAISDRQKLIFLRRVRRMQEIATKEKAGRKLKFLEMNQQGIDDDYTENNIFVKGEILATSCVAHLGKIFVFLRACMQQSKLCASDGIFADIFPGGQKQRTVLGLGNLPGEIDHVILPRDMPDLKDMINFNELPALLKLKYTSEWKFGTEELEQMKLIFLQRYCNVDVDRLIGQEVKVKDTQTEMVDVVSLAERKRRDAKYNEALAKIQELQQEVELLKVQGSETARSMSPSAATADVLRSVAREALEGCSSHGSPVAGPQDGAGTSGSGDGPSALPPLASRSGPTSPTAVVPGAVLRPPSRELDLGIPAMHPKPGSVDTAQIMMQAVRTQMRDVATRLGQEMEQVSQIPSRGNTPVLQKPAAVKAPRGPHGAHVSAQDDPSLVEQSDAAIVGEIFKRASGGPKAASILPALRNPPGASGSVLVVASPTNVSDPDLENIRIEKTHTKGKSLQAASREPSTTVSRLHHGAQQQTNPVTKKGVSSEPGVSRSGYKAQQSRQDDQSRVTASRKRLGEECLPTGQVIDDEGVVSDDHKPVAGSVESSPIRILPALRPANQSGTPSDAPSLPDEAAVGSLMLTATAAEQVLINAMIQCRTMRSDANAATNGAPSTTTAAGKHGASSAEARPGGVRMPEAQVSSLTGASDKVYSKVVKLKTKLHPGANDGHPPYREGRQFSMAKMLPVQSSALVTIPEDDRHHSMLSLPRDEPMGTPASAFCATPIPRSVVSRLRGVTPPLLEDRKISGGEAEAAQAVKEATDEAIGVFTSLKNRLPARAANPANSLAAARQWENQQKRQQLVEQSTAAAASALPVDPVVKAMIDSRSTPTALAAPQFSYVE